MGFNSGFKGLILNKKENYSNTKIFKCYKTKQIVPITGCYVKHKIMTSNSTH